MNPISFFSNPLKILLFFILFFTFNLQALTLTDDFEISENGWQTAGTTRVSYGTPINSTVLRVDVDSTWIGKTYNFGTALANRNVTIEFDLWAVGGWESSGDNIDYFYVEANGVRLINGETIPGTDSNTTVVYKHYSLSAITDNVGELTLRIGQIVSYIAGEQAHVDNFSLTVEEGVPVITPDTFSISEAANNSSSVGTVLATNNPTTFSIISGNTDGIFAINNSGLIYVADRTNLDFETTSSYTLEIKASNGSGSDTALFTIDVIDVPPPILSPATFTVLETATNGVTVGTVTATNSPTTFTIIAGNNDGIFTIDNNGKITIIDNTNLDFDVTPSYSLEIEVSNNAESSTGSVVINIEDVNPPVASDQTFTISDDATNEDLVGTIIASGDPDTFTIIAGNIDSIFRVENNGDLIIDNNLNLNASLRNEYTLRIRISNNEGSTEINVTILVTPQAIVNGDYRDFTLRTQMYLKGNMKTIGNTVLVPPTQTPEDNKDYDITDTMCDTYTNGSFISNASETNDEYFLCEYQLDLNTKNSTSAQLIMPEKANIAWVGLYWQAIIHNDDFTTNMSVKLGRTNDEFSDFNYTAVTPKELDFKADEGTEDFTSYSAFADVTEIFKVNGWKSGNYIVANIPVTEGKNDGLGLYGAWTLVVIYEDSLNPAEKFRSFSIFDGWQIIQADKYGGPNDLQVDVSGFYTPDKTDITSTVSVFTAEGDKNIEGDTLTTIDYNNNSTVTLPSGSDNTFNSSIVSDGSRMPSLTNNNGIDIQSYPIGDYLIPKQTGMEFHFKSDQDTYWPSMIAFQTELVAPALCYDYTFKQNGRYLTTENNGSKLPTIEGYIDSSDIEVGLYLRSTYADFPIQGISLFTDRNSSKAAKMPYVHGTTFISEANSPTYHSYPNESYSGCNYDDGITTDRVCSRDNNIRIGLGDGAIGYSQDSSGMLDSGEYMYTKFDVAPIGYAGDVNVSLDLKLNYYIVPKTGGLPIPYTYTLGVEVPMCPPSAEYTPYWGTFNIIDRTLNAGGTAYNNLLTQVAKQPFNVDLIMYTKDPVTQEYTQIPDFDFNTTVQVEIIDAEGFNDINSSSCTNPDAAISQAIFVNSVTTQTNNKTQVFTPGPDFYNFAARSAAFRIWVFHDDNQSMISGWTANTPDNISLTSINGLYQNGRHTLCSDAADCGSDPTSLACFDCIKNNYASPICSRDNFSIRPEALQITINDTNQSDSPTTTVNLSDIFGYDPLTTTSNQYVNLAAGYNYSFDFTATNHVDLNPTPGYLARFSVPNDTNATLYWEPSQTTLLQSSFNPNNCNDVTSKTFTNGTIGPWLKNGQENNYLYGLSQVGQYRLNLEDVAWTRVDYDPNKLAHHRIDRNFIVDATDCDSTRSSTSIINNRIGCTISSEHLNTDSTHTLSGTNHTYQDHAITFKPHHFDLSRITPSIGLAQNSFDGGNYYVYMHTMDTQLNANQIPMAVQFSGTFDAVGKDNVRLSNYVDGCFAQELNISAISAYRIPPNDGALDPDDDGITTYGDADTSNDLQYRRFIRINNTAASTNILVRVNDGNITLSQEDNISTLAFPQAMRGQSNIEYYINYDRRINNTGVASMQPNNPAVRVFKDFNITCKDTQNNNCSIYTDLIQKDYNGTIDLQDTNVTFVYGRVYTPRTTTQSNTANFNINYELFCDACRTDTTLNTLMNKTFNMVSSPYGLGWFTNKNHALITDGNIADDTIYTDDIIETRSIVRVTGDYDPVNFKNGKQPAQASYNPITTTDYPYKTMMAYQPSLWLYYDKYNPLGNLFRFQVIFSGAPGSWTGQGVTKSGKSESSASGDSSRRIQW